MINFKDNKNKSPLNTRWAQMTKQEQIIERKKMEIQAKLEAQKEAAALSARAKLSNPPSKDDKGNANIFSNDGSFMSQFKALLEKQKQEKEEKERKKAEEEKKKESREGSDDDNDERCEERQRYNDRGHRDKHSRWNERGRIRPRSPMTPVAEDRNKCDKNTSNIPALMQIPIKHPDEVQESDPDHNDWSQGPPDTKKESNSDEQNKFMGCGPRPPGPMPPGMMGPGMMPPNMGPGPMMCPGGPNMPPMPPGSMPPFMGGPPNFSMPPNFMGPNGPGGPMPPNMMPSPNGPMPPFFGPPFPNPGMMRPNGPPNMPINPGMGPNGPLMRPNGPLNSMMGPNGPPNSMKGSNGPPNSMMGPNGPPNSMMGPNGPPNSMMGPNGPNSMMGGPNCSNNNMMPPNGPLNSMMGPNGPPNNMLPPNGPPKSMMGPNGPPMMGSRPPNSMGPNGPLNSMGGNSPPNAMMGPNGNMRSLGPRPPFPPGGRPFPGPFMGAPSRPDIKSLDAGPVPPLPPPPLNTMADNNDMKSQVLSADGGAARAGAAGGRPEPWDTRAQDPAPWCPRVRDEDKYEPEFSLRDDDSDEGLAGAPTAPSADRGHSKGWVKREAGSSQSDSEGESRRERRKRKKKSRWGAEPPVDAQSPNAAAAAALAGAKLAKIDEEGLKLRSINRSNPALVQYAITNYGTTDLSAEDWIKCEDNFKLNLLYQDMLKKRSEVERLAAAGRHKYEYDSDEDTRHGTWEHQLRAREMSATERWADELTRQAAGKHHIGDFLPPHELQKFMENYSAVKSGKEPDLSDYKEFKLKEDNVGFKMLQKLGWSEGQGLGAEGSGIVEPINKAPQSGGALGLGAEGAGVSADDDEFDAYRKRMMLAYRFRPNPLNNPRRPYY